MVATPLERLVDTSRRPAEAEPFLSHHALHGRAVHSTLPEVPMQSECDRFSPLRAATSATKLASRLVRRKPSVLVLLPSAPFRAAKATLRNKSPGVNRLPAVTAGGDPTCAGLTAGILPFGADWANYLRSSRRCKAWSLWGRCDRDYGREAHGARRLEVPAGRRPPR
jgi:hypothetical protein